MCNKLSTDVIQPGPAEPDDTDYLSFLSNAFGYDFQPEEVPLFFEMQDQLDGLYEMNIRDGTNVNGFISFLSSCVRMSSDRCEFKKVYETSFNYLWRIAKFRFSSMFASTVNKNEALTDAQHQCLFVWTELFKLSNSKVLKSLPKLDEIEVDTLERVINEGFSAILLNVWSVSNRVVPCTCVASAWNVYLSRTSKPIEALNNIYKAVTNSGGRPTPTITEQEGGEWGTVAPSIEIDVPYSDKLPVVLQFDDAVKMAMVRLPLETILATMFALYPHVCTAFIQVEAFSKNLSMKIKHFSDGLYRTLVEFIDRVPEIVPSLDRYLKTITKIMAAEECVDNFTLQLSSYSDFSRTAKMAIGTPGPSEDDFVYYVNLLVKCVTARSVNATESEKLVSDVGSLWVDNSGKNSTRITRYCLIISALSVSTNFPSVPTQMRALADNTVSTSCIWMIFLALPKIHPKEWSKPIEVLKKLISNIPDLDRSDLLDALRDLLSVNKNSQILTLFPHQEVMDLPPPLARKFFSIVTQYLPIKIKTYLKALVARLSTNNVDISIVSYVFALQLGLSKFDFWKELGESLLKETNVLGDLAMGVCESVTSISRDNHGIACGMAMFLGIVKAAEPRAHDAINQVLDLLRSNKENQRSVSAVDHLLEFVRSSRDDVIDAVYDLAIITRVCKTIETMPNEERLEPLQSCVKILCQTDYSRWCNLKISPNHCPNIRLTNNVIKPLLVKQDCGLSEKNCYERKVMLEAVSRIKLPDQQKDIPFFKNFFAEVNHVLETLQHCTYL